MAVLTARMVAKRLKRLRRLKYEYLEEFQEFIDEAVSTMTKTLYDRYAAGVKRGEIGVTFIDWVVQAADLEHTYSSRFTPEVRRLWSRRHLDFFQRDELTLSEGIDLGWLEEVLTEEINKYHADTDWIIEVNVNPSEPGVVPDPYIDTFTFSRIERPASLE